MDQNHVSALVARAARAAAGCRPAPVAGARTPLGAQALVRRTASLSLACAALVGTPWALAAPLPTAPKAPGCLIEPDRVAEVGSQVIGLVDQMQVERGQSVAAGQPLLTLRAEVERANASAAESRSRIDADVRAAAASLKLAEQKVHRTDALVAQNFVSDQAAEQARGEAELARQKLLQVRGQQRVYVDERRVADAQLALRTVRSPFAGVVVERYVSPGERVEERPLVRVAVIDPLRVELMVPTAQYGSLAVGDRVTIRPELPGVDAVVATVRHVDRVLDAASNTFRVRLSLPNPKYRLPAGLRCKADLPATPSAAGAATAPRPVPSAAPVRSPVISRGSL